MHTTDDVHARASASAARALSGQASCAAKSPEALRALGLSAACDNVWRPTADASTLRSLHPSDPIVAGAAARIRTGFEPVADPHSSVNAERIARYHAETAAIGGPVALVIRGDGRREVIG